MAENQRFGQGSEGGLDIPILPLRNSVFFPGSIMPISVGRPKTLAMVKAVEAKGAQGLAPADAVKWAAAELQKIYG